MVRSQLDHQWPSLCHCLSVLCSCWCCSGCSNSSSPSFEAQKKDIWMSAPSVTWSGHTPCLDPATFMSFAFAIFKPQVLYKDMCHHIERNLLYFLLNFTEDYSVVFSYCRYKVRHVPFLSVCLSLTCLFAQKLLKSTFSIQPCCASRVGSVSARNMWTGFKGTRICWYSLYTLLHLWRLQEQSHLPCVYHTQ